MTRFAKFDLGKILFVLIFTIFVLVPEYTGARHNLVPSYYSHSDFARFPNKNSHKVGAPLNPAVLHGNKLNFVFTHKNEICNFNKGYIGYGGNNNQCY